MEEDYGIEIVSDDVLVDRFNSNRDMFQFLIDNGCKYYSEGITRNYDADCQIIIEELKIVYFIPNFENNEYKVVIGGAPYYKKGYLYSESSLQNIVPSLDIVANARDKGDFSDPFPAFRELDGNWFLFLESLS